VEGGEEKDKRGDRGLENRCHVLEIGYVHTGVVVEYDAGVENVTGVEQVLDFAHELHALSAPFQR
jgi:hypothetical protein